MNWSLDNAAAPGLIAAALSAFVALIALVHAKEQKVSEFRQAWIDALREDLSRAISAASTMTLAFQRNDESSRTRQYEEWANFAQALASIELRLNLKEQDHQKLATYIRRAEGLLGELQGDIGNYKPSDWTDLHAEVVQTSQQLLKTEWDRVRDGEPAYKLTKRALIATILLVPIIWAIAALC